MIEEAGEEVDNVSVENGPVFVVLTDVVSFSEIGSG